MSFTLKLFNTTSPKSKIVKDFSLVSEYTGNTTENLDVMNPNILLKLDNIPNANYAYIDVTDKYYWCRFTRENNGLIRCYLIEDVLTTYLIGILNLDVLVDRREFGGDRYIDNGVFIPTSETATEVIKFANGFNEEPVNILITAGG